MTMDAPTLTAALAYHARGWTPLPTDAGSKLPLIPWRRYQTERPTADEVRGWWERHPTAGVGVVTGAVSGLVVLDLDGARALDALRAWGVTALPRTPMVETGRGTHVYLAHPGGTVGNRAGVLPGVDLRAAGGYVVAPPSRHASGRLYRWRIAPDEAPLAPVPAWLVELLAERPLPAGGGSALVPPLADEGPIPAGRRNDTLYRRGRSLRGMGFDFAAIRAALHAENAERCRPPLPHAEVEQLARHVWTQPDADGWAA
jgi:hypothetical protein